LREITERTLIPLSIFAVLAGGIFWLSSLFATVSQHTQQLQALETKQEKVGEILQMIREDLADIKAAIKQRKE
jgi:hypothetical protein